MRRMLGKFNRELTASVYRWGSGAAPRLCRASADVCRLRHARDSATHCHFAVPWRLLPVSCQQDLRGTLCLSILDARGRCGACPPACDRRHGMGPGVLRAICEPWGGSACSANWCRSHSLPGSAGGVSFSGHCYRQHRGVLLHWQAPRAVASVWMVPASASSLACRVRLLDREVDQFCPGHLRYPRYGGKACVIESRSHRTAPHEVPTATPWSGCRAGGA